MKKLILLSALAALGATGAYAQHAGQFGVGLNLGVQPVIEGKGSPTHFLLGGRLQYSFSNSFRTHLDLNGGFKDKNLSTFQATLNGDYMIPVASRFYLYPSAGLGFGNVHYSNHGYSDNDAKFVFNVGLGAEYEVNRNVAVGLEYKYQYMEDYSSLPILFNVSYKF